MFGFKKKRTEIEVPIGDTRFWWMKGNCMACCTDIKNSNPPEYTLRLGNERIGLCKRCAKILRDKLVQELGES